MRRVHVVGRKNHGKTQLVIELVAQLRGQGFRVGVIKHTHHRHELDTPGKDSYRHRAAGAAPVGIVSESLSAVFLPSVLSAAKDHYAALEPLFADCDLVLVEGDVNAAAPKFEVWRASAATPPLAAQDASIQAIVTDDAPPVSIPRLPRSDLRPFAQWLTQFVRSAENLKIGS